MLKTEEHQTHRMPRRLFTRYPCCLGKAYFDLWWPVPLHRFQRGCSRCGQEYDVRVKTTHKPTHMIDVITWEW